MSPEVHNRGISILAKRTYVLQKDVFGISLPEVIHPEGTSIGSDNCDFLKVSDFNGSL